MGIDSHAIVDPEATLADDVSVGAFSIIGPNVEISSGTWIGPHVTINGPTRIGKNNRIFQYASLGDAPQDMHYEGENTRLDIGDNNIIREFVTMNRGTTSGGEVTSLGDNNFIMSYAHIAHDCKVGNYTIFANNASLAGHVIISDHAILSGFTLVHQFVSIGEHCFTGMGSAISKDVPPYMRVAGNPAKAFGMNSEGLKRRGFSADALSDLRKAYKILYKSRLTLEDAVNALEEMAVTSNEISNIVTFIKQARRSIIR